MQRSEATKAVNSAAAGAVGGARDGTRNGAGTETHRRIGAGRGRRRRLAPVAVVLAAVALAGWGDVSPAAPADGGVEDRARIPVPEEVASAALEEAMRYVEVVHHTPEGDRAEGVPYYLGGQDSVEVFLEKVVDGQVDEAGIDASGLVVNAYRAVVPELEFWWDADGTERQDDAASATLFRHNVQPVEVDALRPGDLLFFGAGPDRVNGVVLFREVRSGVVRFVSASASEGRVVETGAVLNGNYWDEQFVGAGRLLMAPALAPSS